jgi:hypothetical protein
MATPTNDVSPVKPKEILMRILALAILAIGTILIGPVRNGIMAFQTGPGRRSLSMTHRKRQINRIIWSEGDSPGFRGTPTEKAGYLN